MTFQADISNSEGIQQVVLSGRLDSITSYGFEQTLPSIFEKAGQLVVMDFSALNYVSSAGIRVFLIAAKRAKQIKGRMVLFDLQPHVKEVFDMSGILNILEVTDNRSSALAIVNEVNG